MSVETTCQRKRENYQAKNIESCIFLCLSSPFFPLSIFKFLHSTHQLTSTFTHITETFAVTWKMAVVSAPLVAFGPNSSPSLSPSTVYSQSCSMHSLTVPSSQPALLSAMAASPRKRSLSSCTFALEKSNLCERSVDVVDEEINGSVLGESSETRLYSFSPVPLLLLAALPGGNAFPHFFQI